MSQPAIPIRERKYAQTKLALTREAVKQMKDKRFQDISAKELCDPIPISEVTFYNYFPKKTDLLVYLWELWQLETAWHLERWETEKGNIAIIESYFDLTAQGIEQYPWVLREAFGFFMQSPQEFRFQEVTIAERLLTFPELPGIEAVQFPKASSQQKLLYTYAERAIASGELPEGTEPNSVATILIVILSGVIMTLVATDPTQIRPTFRQMLRFLWQGLRMEDAQDIAHERALLEQTIRYTWTGTYLTS